MAIIWDKGFKTPVVLEAPAASPPLLKEEDNDDSQAESPKPAYGFGR